MILSPSPNWVITAVDQSIAAGRRRFNDPGRHSSSYGVTIRSTAVGRRMEVWEAASAAGYPDEVDRIAIHALGVGDTYEAAFEDLVDRIESIERLQPIT